MFVVGEGIVSASTGLEPQEGTEVGWPLPWAPPPVFRRAAGLAGKDGEPLPIWALREGYASWSLGCYEKPLVKLKPPAHKTSCPSLSPFGHPEGVLKADPVGLDIQCTCRHPNLNASSVKAPPLAESKQQLGSPFSSTRTHLGLCLFAACLGGQDPTTPAQKSSCALPHPCCPS